jgi:serine protease Do
VRQGASGIGFAIPVDKAITVASELMSLERLENRWHGIVAKPNKTGTGMIVEEVTKNSPAEKAGIKVGDTISKIDNTIVNRQLDIERALLGRKSIAEIPLVLQRDQSLQTVALTLEARPKSVDDATSPYWQALGLKLAAVPSQQFKQTHSRYRGGLAITAVRNDSPAAKQGLKKGDVLVGLHIWETISTENIDYILGHDDLRDFSPLKFRILRGNEEFFGFLPVNTIKR